MWNPKVKICWPDSWTMSRAKISKEQSCLFPHSMLINNEWNIDYVSVEDNSVCLAWLNDLNLTWSRKITFMWIQIASLYFPWVQEKPWRKINCCEANLHVRLRDEQPSGSSLLAESITDWRLTLGSLEAGFYSQQHRKQWLSTDGASKPFIFFMMSWPNLLHKNKNLREISK